MIKLLSEKDDEKHWRGYEDIPALNRIIRRLPYWRSYSAQWTCFPGFHKFKQFPRDVSPPLMFYEVCVKCGSLRLYGLFWDAWLGHALGYVKITSFEVFIDDIRSHFRDEVPQGFTPISAGAIHQAIQMEIGNI